MRYWWVNRNQTFRKEIAGGYLWCPKRNKNGHRNPFYEFMREVSPGASFSHSAIPESRRSASSVVIAGKVPSRRSSAPPARVAAIPN